MTAKAGPRHGVGLRKRLWHAVRARLAGSRMAKRAVAGTLASLVRLVRWTNRPVPGSMPLAAGFSANPNVIFALWHGQHLLSPAYNHPDHPIVVMVSRSADAEINALVAKKLGVDVVRGSGGREKDREKVIEKGGARALIALKKTLDSGKSVAMIADIPHGTPRQAGPGIITLARISGRPIVPFVVATSRRKVIEKSWDRTTINLPFGRVAVLFGPQIAVPKEADDATMEAKRAELTAVLEAETQKAYSMLDGGR